MRRLLLTSFLLLSSLSFGQRLFYPEGSAIPRYMTPAEQAYIDRYGYGPGLDVNAPPVGSVRCPAEYEPMEGIIVSWEGDTNVNAFMVEMIKGVTTPEGGATVYVSVDSGNEQTTVVNRFLSEGISLSKIKFIVTPTDTVWLRDYGPRYIYQGGVRAIVDHIYNRPRPLDNDFPVAFAGFKKHQFYSMDLVHGGGNYHLDALDNSFATRLVVNENSGLSEAAIVAKWQQYQHVNTTLFNQFPTSVDATGHLDMWMQVVSNNTVVISTWPNAPTSTQAQICNAAATTMQSRGYTVFRIPAYNFSGVHYTYTNVVMCNDAILIPSYTNGNVSPSNAAALATWQAAAPGKRIIQVNAQNVINLAGAMHCMMMHLPKPLGGTIPKAYITNLNTREILHFNETRTIEWVTDDDEAVVSCDMQLRTITGKWLTIATNLPPNGQFQWTVPALKNSSALLRVRARDALGNEGIDETDSTFVISP